jgi:hypothetical protein
VLTTLSFADNLLDAPESSSKGEGPVTVGVEAIADALRYNCSRLRRIDLTGGQIL